MELVKLKHEWHGNPAGTVLKVTDYYANTLFQRNAAEMVPTESIVAIKDRLRRIVADRIPGKLKK